MITATLELVGTRPLLWHVFGPDAIPLEKKEKTGVAGNDPIEWTRTVLMNDTRQLYFPPSYIFGMLRDAARHTKKGKGSIQPSVAATLQIVDDQVLVDRFVPEEPSYDATQPVYIHVSSVRNPATKARNVRYRIAASVGWKLTCHILWDPTIVSRAEMEAVANDAGQLVGLGSGRSIGLGRFKLERFTVN